MGSIKQLIKNFRKSIKRTQMTRRFIIFYFGLIFLPMIIFISWYSLGVVREHQTEKRYEKHAILENAAVFFSSYLQQSRFVYESLQSNTALLNFLENSYYSISDEILTYQTQIKPIFSSMISTNSVIDEIFVYRFNKSTAITHSEMIYYFLDIDEFPYDSKILKELEVSNTCNYLALNPQVVRRKDENSFSPRLIFYMNLYRKDYSAVVGILEVQLDLNKILQLLNYSPQGDSLYLKYQDEYYPIQCDRQKSCLIYETPPLTAPPQGSNNQLISSSVKGAPIELVNMYDSKMSNQKQVLENIILCIVALFIPMILFCVIIYRYTSRLLNFSRHIRKSDKTGLIPYQASNRADEIDTVIYEYNKMIGTIGSLIESTRRAEQLKNDANYYALASQINPHFMFNTLENIRMRIEIEKYTEASDMLFILSRFLRYNISMRKESTLLDELNQIRHYLLIYQYRQNNDAQFDLQIPEDSINIRCPFCILQPIVENCLKHGWENENTLKINISVYTGHDAVYVDISDNGRGMQPGQIEQLNMKMKSAASSELYHNNGSSAENTKDGTNRSANVRTNGSIGLTNVNSRLKYFYGVKYGISFRANSPKGVVCTLSFAKEGFLIG